LVSIDSRAIFRILSFVTRPQFMDEGRKLQAGYLFRFFAAGSAIEYGPQCLASVRSPDPGYFFRCALSHDPAAFLAALRPQVDDPVRALNNVQVMFDYYYGIAERNKLMQHLEQPAYIFEMQAGGRLIQYVDCPARRSLGQLAGQLDSLGFATR